MVVREFGPPSVMKLEEVPTPEPGPGQVLLKVHAVSVNRTLDTKVRAGKYARPVKLPLVLGVDPSGVIAKLGPGVTDRKVGDRVTVRSASAAATTAAPMRSASRACTPGAAMPNMSAPPRPHHDHSGRRRFPDRHGGDAPCADRAPSPARQGEARRMGPGDGRRRRARQRRSPGRETSWCPGDRGSGRRRPRQGRARPRRRCRRELSQAGSHHRISAHHRRPGHQRRVRECRRSRTVSESLRRADPPRPPRHRRRTRWRHSAARRQQALSQPDHGDGRHGRTPDDGHELRGRPPASSRR